MWPCSPPAGSVHPGFAVPCDPKMNGGNPRKSAGHSWEIYGDPQPDPADTETTGRALLLSSVRASGDRSAIRTKLRRRAWPATFVRVVRIPIGAGAGPPWQMCDRATMRPGGYASLNRARILAGSAIAARQAADPTGIASSHRRTNPNANAEPAAGLTASPSSTHERPFATECISEY